jgi:M6 family metalloprotease-like protein
MLTRRLIPPVLLAALLVVPLGFDEVRAQDVEMLGREYGTTPPEAYFQEIAADPGAFQFGREGRDRLLHMQQSRGASFQDLVLRYGVVARSLGPRDVPMVGTFRFPLVLGLFSESPEPAYDLERVQREYFTGPSSYSGTVTELYHEMSGGRVELEGEAFPWVRTGLTAQQVARSQSGLSSHQTEGVGAFVEEIVLALDAQGVDWSAYDNSGDGFVDVLTVLHPTDGAECGGNPDKIWSHRWTLQNATQGRLSPGIRTSTPRPDGSGYIYIGDYTIQPLLACHSSAINPIGVFAHELGHGFGLPDLYGTYGTSHPGVGRWDLMGTGAWGCRGGDPARPCHMGAWSKAMLGWVDVVDLGPDVDHGTLNLPPVQSSQQVFRVPTPFGFGPFYLLENRQRIGFDEDLWEPGLLIWQIDPEVVGPNWPTNRVNRDPGRMGVWLRQSDGTNSLTTSAGMHAHPGHPFPGCIKESVWEYGNPDIPCARTNTVFHAGSTPASRGTDGGALAITITGIERSGGVEPHDILLDLSTRITRVTVEAEFLGARVRPEPGEALRVDGEPLTGPPMTILAAPYDRRTLEAPPGRTLAEGVRVGFMGWTDGAPRVRELEVPLADTVLGLLYGDEEVRVRWAPSSSQGEISPGTLETQPASPDLWFPRGTEVEIRAAARPGFAFREWTGGLEGRPNPTTLVVDGPITVEAWFDYYYGLSRQLYEAEIEAAVNRSVWFEVEGGQGPFQWSVVEGELPDGMNIFNSRIAGAAMEVGEFPVRVRVRDASGLEAEAQVHLVVTPPAVGMDRLTGPFLGTGAGLTGLQRLFMDRHGNQNGDYDVGDLRAFLRTFGDVPEVTPASPGPPEAPSAIQLRLEAQPEEGR